MRQRDLRCDIAFRDTNLCNVDPQIGTYRVDTAGVKLMGDWIASIKSCL